MIRNIIITITIFLLSGCGAGGSQNSSTSFDITKLNLPYHVNNAPAQATISNIQKLSNTVVTNKNNRIVGRSANTISKVKNKQQLIQNLLFSSITNHSSTQRSSCIDYKITSKTSTRESATLTYNHCNIGGTITDGVLYMDTYSSKVEITFATDLTLSTNGKTTTIYQGGKMMVDNLVYDYYDRDKIIKMRVISSLFSQTNGLIYGSYMLISTYEKLSSTRLKYCIKSGRVYIENGYFIVDDDSSCMVFDGNTLLPSGTFKYQGEDYSSIEIEASDYDELTLSKDEDGDGIFEYSEEINL